MMKRDETDERLATLAHEMRTPIQSIDLICELIQKNPNLPVSQLQKKLATMRQGCRSLMDLLDEATSPSYRIPAMTNHRLYQPLSLHDLAGYLCDQLKPMANEQKRDLVLELDEVLPHTIRTHPVWLEQILRNLIINAIRHGTGTIRLAFNFDSNGIRMSVSDEGPGIPVEMQQKIFKPRVRLTEHPYKDGSTGMGLGLSLASNWTRRLGGTLKVESKPGSGSTFSLTLPFFRPGSLRTPTNPDGRFSHTQDKGSLLRHRSEPDATIAGKSVLIVDDSELQRDALREYLAAAGATILTASRAREAVQRVSRNSVDAIILDLNLPDSDGRDLVHLLRSHTHHHATPIIIYSGEIIDPKTESILGPMVQRIRKKKIGSHHTILKDLEEQLVPELKLQNTNNPASVD